MKQVQSRLGLHITLGPVRSTSQISPKTMGNHENQCFFIDAPRGVQGEESAVQLVGGGCGVLAGYKSGRPVRAKLARALPGRQPQADRPAARRLARCAAWGSRRGIRSTATVNCFQASHNFRVLLTLYLPHE